tara:strand:- start:861 stop:1076 length:216 start_codon:yes stop_codon:yes gene_type:complete
MKDKIDSQIESWEKQIDTEKAKLKEKYADAKNENATDDLKDEAKETIEKNIDALKDKIAKAKAEIDDLVES